MPLQGITNFAIKKLSKWLSNPSLDAASQK